MEGNSVSSLIVESNNPIAELANNQYLVSLMYSEDIYRYTLSANSYQGLEELLARIEQNSGLKHFVLSR